MCLLLARWFTGCLAGSASVVSLEGRLARPVSTLEARSDVSEWRSVAATLGVNPRDGMGRPCTVPAAGNKLKRVYL